MLAQYLYPIDLVAHSLDKSIHLLSSLPCYRNEGHNLFISDKRGEYQLFVDDHYRKR
jgi:hypothetical protein